MRVVALADIHGNLPALEAVLAEVEREQPDLIVVCGDVASGPMPGQTIDALRKLRRARFVRGNADRGVLETFDGRTPAEMPGPHAEWCAGQITREQRDFLASFESTVTVDDVDAAGRVLFCHASPRNDVDVFTVETPADRIRTLMAGVDAQLVVCGHTHMQFDRTVDGVRIVNAGSVGMPYGKPGAYWVQVGPGPSPRRTDYDREEAADRIRSAGAPFADEFARENVLSVPTVGEAMAFLRRAAERQTA